MSLSDVASPLATEPNSRGLTAPYRRRMSSKAARCAAIAARSDTLSAVTMLMSRSYRDYVLKSTDAVHRAPAPDSARRIANGTRSADRTNGTDISSQGMRLALHRETPCASRRWAGRTMATVKASSNTSQITA